MNKKARLKLKDDILIGYGSKCNCCGELTKEFLQIDHIFNDGAEERKSKNYGEVYKLWRKLRKLGYPKDRYQILCANCNWAKGFYGECPHKKNKEIVCQSN